MSDLLSKDDYLIIANLEAVDLNLLRVLNKNGCVNWSVCPECHMDDFTHVEGCSILESLDCDHDWKPCPEPIIDDWTHCSKCKSTRLMTDEEMKQKEL